MALLEEATSLIDALASIFGGGGGDFEELLTVGLVSIRPGNVGAVIDADDIGGGMACSGRLGALRVGRGGAAAIGGAGFSSF